MLLCHWRPAWVLLVLLSIPLFPFQTAPPTVPSDPPPEYPPAEVLHYGVEWRLINAGLARLSWRPKSGDGRQAAEAGLHLESAGLVSKLYKVDDDYLARIAERFCVTSTYTRAHEGSRRRETNVTFHGAAGKATYVERDLIKDTEVSNKEIEIPSCVHDILAALYRLRVMKVDPGQTVHLPVSDGKKSISAKIEAQEREQIKAGKKTYQTIRYEAFLFNDVLYRRKGRLFIWLTDDDRRLPVQFRVRLQFHIGTITLKLEKEEAA
jgi:hypothetical protein